MALGNVNQNQFGKALTPIAKAAKPTGTAATRGIGGGVAVGAGLGRAAATGAGMVAKAAPFVGGPVGMGAAAAYGASQTPGGKSIVKGAVKGAGGPNMGLGILGAPLGAVKGAMNSKGFGNVASGAAKGGLIGALGGPVGSAIGAGIGAIGGLFSHRGMGAKPKAATGSPVPNRATPYTVQKGDTLTSIAKANNTTVAGLRAANPKMMANPKYKQGNMIWSGTKVNIK